jgi:hypothetical protein
MVSSALVLAAASASLGAAAQVPDGAVLVPLYRNTEQSAYLCDFFVGTPPQKHVLKVDSGSPTYSFINPRNPVCALPTRPCDAYGTFDNTTSSTSIYEGTGFANYLNSHGSGDFLNDTVAVGGVSTEHMYFGYLNQYGFPDRAGNPAYSVLGLSLDCAWAGPQCTDQGPYLLPQLKNASTINYMATSYYLGPDDSDAKGEMILGGAYDAAKIGGDIITLPMVDPFNTSLTSGQTNVVNVTALEVVAGQNSTRETYGKDNVGSPVLLDTGVASWYVPVDIADAIIAGLGGLVGEPNPRQPYNRVDCKYRSAEYAKGHVSVEFGSAGKVDIPLDSLVTKLSDDSCVTYVYGRGDQLSIFGDAFLRGVYSIFDQETFTVSLAEVRHTEEQNIVPLPKCGFSCESK